MNAIRLCIVSIICAIIFAPLALFAQTPSSPIAPISPTNSTAPWLKCNADQLRNGQCSFNIYQSLGIKQSTSEDPTSVGLFIQDIILSLTFFIGTVVTIVIIVAWMMYIWSGIQWDEGMQSTAKKWLINGLVGMLIVMSSYVIIRLVQFMVRGG